MLKNNSSLIIGLLLGILIGLGISHFFLQPSTIHHAENIQSTTSPVNPIVKNQNTIPDKVFTILHYIKEHHAAMDGYVGGRIFKNREGHLPKTTNEGTPIEYQEWDVNPKREGQNRGTERICTGSDGRSWYTHNHYQSFTEIK